MTGHPLIHVEVKRGGKETHIKVSGWPDKRSDWFVYTPDEISEQVDSPEWDPADEGAIARRIGCEKGRVLQAVGWHRFKPNVGVGALILHVSSSKPLLIKRVEVIPGLTASDEREIRIILVACALAVSQAMREKGVGNGCVDWEVPADEKGRYMQLFPVFGNAPNNVQPRGDRAVIRACPPPDNGSG